METATLPAALPPVTPPLPVTKISLTWETNYNHKLGTDAFIHVDILPNRQALPPRSSITSTVYAIGTRDGSHKPVDYLLDDITPMALREVLSWLTIASHGMDYSSYRTWFLEKYKGATLETMCMVCVYATPANYKVFSEHRRIGSLNGNYWIA